MTALTIFLIAVSLSMDAFAVSVCGGMRLAEDRKFRGGLLMCTPKTGRI